MTTMSADIMDELSAMEDLIDQADARRAADRDPSVPVGASLGETDLGNGSKIIQTKQDSLAVTANGTPLPGRTPVYHRLQSNQIHWVDTGRLAYHLAKRVNGQRVFSLKPWDVEAPVIYEKTCHICQRNGVTKKFIEDMEGDGETKYVAHMTAFHGQQWDTMLRQIERDERREEQTLLREMLATVTRKDSPTADDIEALVQARLAELLKESASEPTPAKERTIPCPSCDQMFINENGLRLHSRKHQASVEV